MSDFDKGRGEIRPRKFYQERRDVGPPGNRRLPIIIAKPDRGDRDAERERDRVGKPQERAVQPTIILRTREGESRAVSPSQRPAAVLRKDAEPQTPVYHLASKLTLSESVNPLAAPPEMRGCLKLVDEYLQMSDSCLEYLVDQNDFIVVGCLGPQGVGKSTVMSWLASSDPDHQSRDGWVFKPQAAEHYENGVNCTSGVDLYVTSSRMIVLDMQAVLSHAVLDRLAHLDSSKKFCPLEFASVEGMVEMHSLELAAFLLSVCHVVFLVQDWFFDPNMLRFLQSAEMLKPSTPTTSQDEEIIEYFPHVVFLHNKAQPSDFSPKQVRLMQSVYGRAFLRSRVQIQSGIGIASGSVINCLNPSTCGEPLNLFILPEIAESTEKGHFRGHPGFAQLVDKLRRQVLGVAKQPLTHTVLSEKNWFHYAYKVWEGIKKSSFFLEYSRLLP